MKMVGRTERVGQCGGYKCVRAQASRHRKAGFENRVGPRVDGQTGRSLVFLRLITQE